MVRLLLPILEADIINIGSSKLLPFPPSHFPSPIQEGLVPFGLLPFHQLQFHLLITAQCCFAYSCKM